MKKPHILAVHLLNDRSGSPLVLRQSLEVLAEAGYAIDLLTATPGAPGFLSDLPGVTTHALAYRWSASAWRTLLNFGLVQWLLFWKVLRLATADSTVYVNTLLPAGAALAARCRGTRVVYHLHEVSLRPALLRRLLCTVAARTAHQVLCVSEHVRTALALPVARQAVVHNALAPAFVAKANQTPLPNRSPEPFVVLMACSLRDYKGIPEFVALARAMPALRFELVLNAAPAAVASYRNQILVPNNLTLFPAAHDMHPHYQRAAVVLNLSRPDEWVETFGMTILEAMSYGRPVIVPPVGGVAEVNVHTHTGFAINGRHLEALQQALGLLAHNSACYVRMATAARQRAASFAPSRFAGQVLATFRAEQPGATAPAPTPVPMAPDALAGA
ncbi:glycosyltransferase family 4 protein [Hymenobacter siberiensis]|jgi:glycosyltransferase involved in cell wall biosynthesis|uniref:glycosyltransferase family 4 protein n=1 Tax=Hymenobacter siberiensis TaxID=2848396 RepID=UPI001C1E6667|nr:glycosyltransferase family 4 protein [Hymenobacter siberiensis]MBU6121967.1 glycosyltransferase family 4 protein [Hymenobacter siberiensis]